MASRSSIRLVAAFAASLAFAGAARAGKPEITVYATHSPATVLIVSSGKMFNSDTEVEVGSGLLIGNRVVITNNHVVLDPKNYQTLDLSVRIGGITKQPIAVPTSDDHIFRDPENDLAIIVLPENAAPDEVDCPVSVMENGDLVPVGSDVILLGYPAGQDVSVGPPGTISNKSGKLGRWTTSVLFNPGNSGGPLFSEDNVLVGFAVSGIVKYNDREVDGVNFFIPVPVLLKSPLFTKMQGIPQRRQCWGKPQLIASNNGPRNPAEVPDVGEPAEAFEPEEHAPAESSGVGDGNGDDPLGSSGEVAASAPSPSPPAIDKVSLSFTVDRTKDDHPVVFAPHSKTYEDVFPTEPGFKIESCAFSEFSANNARDIACAVEPDGSAAKLTYRLTSGPAVDRWRGWLGGTVTLTEKRVD
jgi:hypothetical protein